MLEQAAAESLEVDINLCHFALLVACIIAYTLLCRVSEYLRKGKDSKHHLRAKSVVFWIAHDNPASVTMASPYLRVPSSEAWRYSQLRHRLLGVSVCIKDSKKDPFGVGFTYPIPRYLGPRTVDFVYDFAEVLFDWAVRARPHPNEPFISSPLQKINVSADSMNVWLKEVVAPMFGLDPNRVHTHSLRFTGASTLSAAKVPDSVIMRMGRWASLSFLHYIRLAASTFTGVAAALANRTTFTIQDVRNLMPGAAP
jgi:hypothetical protein